jgi:hypothetical protein
LPLGLPPYRRQHPGNFPASLCGCLALSRRRFELGLEGARDRNRLGGGEILAHPVFSRFAPRNFSNVDDVDRNRVVPEFGIRPRPHPAFTGDQHIVWRNDNRVQYADFIN